MVGYGIYSGISNVIEYKEKYNTTPGEDWSIFLRSSLSLPMAQDVQYLTARKNIVNSIAQEAWRALNSSTDGVVAYAVGFGDMIQKVSVNCKPSGPCTCDTNQFGVGFHKKCDLIELSDKAGHAVIAMDKKSNAN
ncbi:MAG: hypothetical protein KTM48_00620, partial [Wolbachia endosymbiont of Pissodes strobi]|nr:hypothetical protein [Wolbachia endosymbiont of Pissodes strobi]